jgi:hypothetical protein
MRNLKILLLSLVINIILMGLFVEFVMVPINIAAKAIAQNICKAQGINCDTK